MSDFHNRPQVTVILPAFNEAGSIGSVIAETSQVLYRTSAPFEILVIDDGSTDDTAAQAEAAGARVFRHPDNLGNGAAIKSGIRLARGRILVMLDADGQHPPDMIPGIVEKIGPYDMAVCARTRESDTALYRDLANVIYNWLASYVCDRRIDDLTSGYRAIKASVARRFLYLLPNGFSYPTTLTLAVVRSGRRLVYVPVNTRRRSGKSKIRPLNDGLRFLLIIMRITTFFSPLKVFVPVSVLMFLTGLIYGLFKIIILDTRYGPTAAMLMTVAVFIFMMGLVSEQIAQLRFDRSEIYENDWEDEPPDEPARSD